MRLDARIKLTRQMEATADDGSLSPEVLMIGEVAAAVEIVSSAESDRAAIQTADFKVRASPATVSVRMQDRVEWQGKHYAIESVTPDRINRPKWLTFRGATSQDGSASGMRGTPYQEPAPTTIAVVIGTVTTGGPGTDAEAEITGSAPTFTLNLTIPRGADGQDGEDGGGSGSSTWAGPNTFQVRLAAGTGAPTLITVGSQFSMSGNTLSLATEYATASSVTALTSTVTSLSATVSGLSSWVDDTEDTLTSLNASLGEKADKTTTITAAGLATGGGSLASNRTITVTAATGAEVITGTETTKAITPAALAAARSTGAAGDGLEAGKLVTYGAAGLISSTTGLQIVGVTGVQQILGSGVSGTVTYSLANDEPAADVTIATREWVDDQGFGAQTAATQAEMEAGTESALRSMSPQRVAQAIAALATSWPEVVKPSATTRSATTTLAADPHLVVPIAANQKMRLRAALFFDTTAAGDFKFGHTSPSGATVRLARTGIGGGGTALTGIQVDAADNTSGAAVAGSGASGFMEFYAVIENGSTAGNFTLTWAQNTSDAGNTTVRAGSYIQYKAWT